MNLLSVIVHLFWLQIALCFTLAVMTGMIFRSRHLYNMKLFTSTVPVRYACMVVLFFGILGASILFFVSQELAHALGIVHIDVLFLRY